MAKKPLADAATAKLAQRQDGRGDVPTLVAPRKIPRQPKSFRLGPVHLERLRRLTERLSEEAGRPLSETEALKGLLLLGEKTDAKKLLVSVKDTVFESREVVPAFINKDNSYTYPDANNGGRWRTMANNEPQTGD